MELDPAKMSKEDICAHLGDNYDEHHGAIVTPIYQNSLFTRKLKSHGHAYSRISNPTLDVLEQKMAALEGGERALAFSSGMAAISAALLYGIKKDCHIIAVKSMYGPVYGMLENYFQKFGVETTFVSGEEVADFEKAIRPNTSIIYLESPVSNVFTMQDLRAIGELARSHNILTIIDNTWATPLYQNPINYGIDIVVHSATKYLGGHSDLIGGVLVTNKEITESMIHHERGSIGAILDPHQAWMLTRSIRTLPVRVAQHAKSGMQVAQYLNAHAGVERVFYPGLKDHPQYELGQQQMSGYTGLLSFLPKGDLSRVGAAAKQMNVFEIGPSWGGFESLMNFPGLHIDEAASEKSGIPIGLIRISVGLESVESIIEDLDRFLHAIR